jgi:hypothetical protein
MLARDVEYLRDIIAILDGLIVNAGVTRGCPKLLRPVVGRLMSWSHLRKVKKVGVKFEPLFRERLELLKHDPNDPAFPEPRDHLQLMMRYAQKHCPEELNSLQDISWFWPILPQCIKPPFKWSTCCSTS